MEKLDKKKVLAVVLIIALIASLVSTVSLLYNSLDMFLHNIAVTGWRNLGREENFIRWQEPYAVITLFAFVVAALGTSAGIASFVVKKESAKKLCLILALCAVGALLVLTVAAAGVNFANEAYRLKESEGVAIKYPYGVYNDSNYVLYSGVMATLVQQLVLSAIISAALLIVSKIDKKSATKAVEANDINSENKGE